MRNRVRLDRIAHELNLRLWAVFFCVIICSALETKAQTDDLVEIHTPDELTRPYRDRRMGHGWLLGFGMENYRPSSWLSRIDEESYDVMFGSANLSMMYFEGGYKWNLGPMALGFLLGYGGGDVSDDRSGTLRKMHVDRTSAKVSLFIDNIMPEPYLVPYGSFGVYQLGVDEREPSLDVKMSGQTKMGTTFSLGLLLQLNWIEDDVSRWARLSSGLENAYLDLFMTQYSKTSSDEDPDASSELNWGVGVRMEF